MPIIYCQKTLLPNESAHALHTGITVAHFAEAGVRSLFFPGLARQNKAACLEEFFNRLGFAPPPPRIHSVPIPFHQKGLYGLLFRYQLWRAMRREEHALCFASSVKEAVMALELRALAGKTRSVPVVFEMHHLISQLKTGPLAAKLHALEKKAFTQSDLVLFNSAALQAQAKDYLPEPVRAAVAPLGYNARIIRPVRDPALPEPAAQSGLTRIAYVGSFQPGKGVETLIHSMRLLPESFHLRVIGGNPPEALLRLHAMSLDAGLENRVQFTGQVEQRSIGNLLADIDIFAIPLETEKDFLAPIKMFEAVGFALPIMATPVSSLRELLVEGQNALFAPNASSEALAQTLFTLGQSPELRKLMRRNNQRLGEQLSSAARVKRLLALFRDAFGQQALD